MSAIHPRALMFAVLAVLAGSCARPPAPAVPFALGKDACSECGMTLSQRESSAEIVSHGASPELFDDVGCLVRRVAGRPLARGETAYVVDRDTGAFVDAAAAVYVRATSVATPMRSGLMAFSTQAAAEASARFHEGKVMTFTELPSIYTQGHGPR